MNTEHIKLGLKENWEQFTILVIVNAFVGGMIGMERSIFPKFAEVEFGIASKTAILLFITAFGITKAITNYFTGKLANRFGRKNLLLFGWFVALPIPFILMTATNWNWVIFANILLGLSQGLTWSSTVVMKIDLVGEKDRGLAMGLNEFAGYFAVGVVAFFSGYIANKYGITPYPFYIGVAISIIGFLLTLFLVKDTRLHTHKESVTDNTKQLGNVFMETTFKNKSLSSITQAGLVNNLNDGMIWGLLPIVLITLNYNTENIGIITAIYPTVWGIGQLFTGKMSDVYSKKAMLFWGMLLQGIAIIFLPFSNGFFMLSSISAVLGLGTALVYPTFLSAIAQATSPKQRAESIGTFRLWRDLGYAFGAIISGITADLFGVNYAIFLIGGLTILSSIIIKFRMPETNKIAKGCIEMEEVKQSLQQNKKIQIIDVRTKEEFEQAHIPNAVNIVLTELKNEAVKFDKNYQYMITIYPVYQIHLTLRPIYRLAFFY
ncbi:MFS transporter [Flavobacterium amniphilum]|uniref:MFS transporter n=1 Tax=Flavobacterium amniphilum TaxID=1834035 RepID=UPI002029F797|nr:MFS transporter [Flavobacterium amniphilum]MCL9805710.1 MFS transporter [Flavobacterium amniphilum]